MSGSQTPPPNVDTSVRAAKYIICRTSTCDADDFKLFFVVCVCACVAVAVVVGCTVELLKICQFIFTRYPQVPQRAGIVDQHGAAAVVAMQVQVKTSDAERYNAGAV